jgi:hypothetical protein
LLPHRGAPHLYIYLTLLDPTFLGSPLQGYFQPEPNIRLMVDVLLTMNEAFCIAGVKFPVPNRQTFQSGVARR